MTWQDIPGWFDWESLYDDVVRLYSGGVLVEVGTYLGRSLCYLGTRVKESGKPFQVVGVDWCVGSGPEQHATGETRNHHAEAVQEGLGSFAGKLHRNVIDCGLQDVITLVVADSVAASKLFLNTSLTMAFIDSRHDYDSVKRDIEAWLPKVKLGGVIAGDDVGVAGEPPVWPGVQKAVRELVPQFKWQAHDSWMWIKS